MLKLFLKIITSAIFPVLFLFGPLFAFADLPGGQPVTFNDLNYILGLTLGFITWGAGILAVIFLVLSGIMTMTAQSDTAKYTKAKARLKHAIIGSLVVMATGVIINTIMAVVNRSFFQ